MNINVNMGGWTLRFEGGATLYVSCTPTGSQVPVFQKRYFLGGWDVEQDDGFKIYYQEGNVKERIVLDLEVNDNVPQTGIRFETWIQLADGMEDDIMTFQMQGTGAEIAAIRNYLDALPGGNIGDAEFLLTQPMIGGRRRRTRRRRVTRSSRSRR